MLTGLCPVGRGFTNSRYCSACPVDEYNNDNGSMCYPCPHGYDTFSLTGAKQCASKKYLNMLIAEYLENIDKLYVTCFVFYIWTTF